MEKIYGLQEWKLNNEIPDSERSVEVNITFKYPYSDQKELIGFEPKVRVKKTDKVYKNYLNSFINLKLTSNYNVIGKKKRPTGIATKIKFDDLKMLNNLDFVASIGIIFVEHAVKIVTAAVLSEKYFCVKMTVVIEEEGKIPKKQNIEKRFVLIKAFSFEDAYQKIEKQADAYSVPYLNTYGRFVRWRIESYDDCYDTDIENFADLDNPEGTEIFSALRSRKNKTKKAWDGKF